MADTASAVSFEETIYFLLMSWIVFHALPCAISTPFGTPVEPEVMIMYALSSGNTSGSLALSAPSISSKLKISV